MGMMSILRTFDSFVLHHNITGQFHELHDTLHAADASPKPQKDLLIHGTKLGILLASVYIYILRQLISLFFVMNNFE